MTDLNCPVMSDGMPALCTSLYNCDGGDYCGECSHGRYYGNVSAGGRKWTFEFSHRFGPVFTKKDGDPKKVQPSEKHPVWDEWQKWYNAVFKNNGIL